MPLLETKRTPANAGRSGTGGRPPFELRHRLGSSGAIRAHNLSPTNAAATSCFCNDATPLPVYCIIRSARLRTWGGMATPIN
jgi:hypothetical protein